MEHQQLCHLDYSGSPERVSLVALSANKYVQGSPSDPVPRRTDAQNLYSKYTAPLLLDTRRTLLPLSFRRRDRLNKVEFSFGVRELLDLFDLQAPIFVGDDIRDEYRFADSLNPEGGTHLVGHLRGGCHVTQVDVVDPGTSDTNVTDDFSRNIYDETEGRLREELSRGGGV